MSTIAPAIVPIFVLLILGYLACRTQFLPDSFWQPAEKATYYILFPLLLINELANAKLDLADASIIIGYAIAIPLIASALCLLAFPLLRINGSDFTSFFQGGIRFNTYIGLAITSGVLPKTSMALAALLIAIMIPFVNIICVTIFAIFTHGKTNVKTIFLNIIKNPLIIGSLIGITINLLGITIPTIAASVMQKLAQMALPLGLLAVGAGLNLNKWQGTSYIVFVSSLIKLFVLPLIIFELNQFLLVIPALSTVLILFSALPTASSAYILARQLGGNAELMAIIITFETLVSLISLPLCLILII
jgi:hypothetical protein